jgi:ComF family protein
MKPNPSIPARGEPRRLKLGRRFVRHTGSLAGGLLDLIFPPTCAFCLADIPDALSLREKTESTLCGDCRERLIPSYEAACGRCGYPSPPGGRATPEQGCPHCATKHFRFERAIAMGVYQGALQTALLRMKHFRGQQLAAAIGRWMAIRLSDRLAAVAPECVVPVPARFQRRIARGANNVRILARRMARQLGVPVLPDLLRWQRNIKRQHTLLPTERRQNVRGALAASKSFDIRGARVLLVDDILTTGATANEATRVLVKAGASQVCVAIVARVADR